MVRIISIHKVTKAKRQSEPMPLCDAMLWLIENEADIVCLFDFEIVSANA